MPAQEFLDPATKPRCYQFERPDLNGGDKVIPEGLRGSGSQTYASKIWGITGTEYIERADPWPMNPNGELI